MNEIKTAVMTSQRDNYLRAAMDRLLRRLRRYMSVCPRRADDEMPDMDVVWVTGLTGSPEQEILEAIKSNPVLWREALPEDVCIVPRKALAKLGGLPPEVIDHLAQMGENIVMSYAYHTANAIEEAEGKRP